MEYNKSPRSDGSGWNFTGILFDLVGKNTLECFRQAFDKGPSNEQRTTLIRLLLEKKRGQEMTEELEAYYIVNQ